jgi:WD40 repeat protein
LDFTPDSRGLVVGESGGEASVIDVTTGDRLNTIGGSASVAGDVTMLEMNVDGNLIAATNWEGLVDVWSAATGELVFSTQSEGDDGLADLTWSGNGEMLAIASADTERGQVAILDRAGARLGTIVAEPGFTFRSVSLSPDGDLAVVTNELAARDDPSTVTAQVWDWRRGEIVTTIETPSVPVAFDSSGTRIATAHWLEGVVDVWDAQTGERLATLVAPTSAWDVTFSGDGEAVATAHVDGTVRLWDAATGVERLVLPGHQGQAFEVEFSPDGSMLASSGGDGIVRVWALDLDDLIAIANDRLTRGFTDDECRQFLHVERCPQTA